LEPQPTKAKLAKNVKTRNSASNFFISFHLLSIEFLLVEYLVSINLILMHILQYTDQTQVNNTFFVTTPS
jgi:hypothetical protein